MIYYYSLRNADIIHFIFFYIQIISKKSNCMGLCYRIKINSNCIINE